MKKTLLILFSLCLSVLAALVFIELFFRIVPKNLIPKTLANQIYQKYEISKQGIYYFDSAIKCQRMKPNFKTGMFFNGYYWKHKTNNLGLRDQVDFEKRISVSWVIR